MMCIYKHCFLPMLFGLIFAMKCYTKIKNALPSASPIIAAYILHLYACLTCSSVHASSLHPLLARHHLCYDNMLMSIAFFSIFDICYIYL